MPFSLKILIPLCAAGALASAGAAQTTPPAPKPQLSPRELFYKASPSDTPRQGKKKELPKGDTPLPDGGKILKAAVSPIGVTYTLQKLVGDDMVDVSPDTVFHAEDRIAFVVQTNYTGYLYIGNQGPGGSWTPLFPSAKIENGNNHIEGFHKYTMPPGYRFVFDKTTGVEKVFILFSREPVPDFEKLLYAQPNGSKSASKPLNVAKVDLPESTVNRLRSTFSSRDLLIEKIDDPKPGVGKEKAVYILAPIGSTDPHLWYEFQLVHK